MMKRALTSVVCAVALSGAPISAVQQPVEEEVTFANGAVYSAYDIPDRLWGLSVTSDQQIAGLLMKLGAGSYLWLLITIIFFRWASNQEALRNEPAAALTFDQVQREFDAHPPPRAEV